ncbi:glutamine amidotransferase [uncultured Sphingomonas sp.]|uniref:glutamine amidotransferase n=1 Tax=uncultured Sphingomonas sp. TaxID=158754 RepID=UPI0025FD5109|nr:glutamine amidotransferase [uncultured Sphingomonas sp.]
MPRALVVRHTPMEGAAGFRLPMEQAGYDIARIDADDPCFAALDWLAPDLVAVMGGPMGVYERDAFPWIEREVTGFALRIAAGRPTIGICLGAQMIAAALGARVYLGNVTEIGFAPVALSDAGAASPLRHLAGVPLLHWHGDTFDLPDGAEHLAASHLYPNQGFRLGNAVLALQFHPEMGEDARFEHWAANEDYVRQAGMTRAALLEDHARLGPAAAAAGRAMLAEWLCNLPNS